MQNTIQIQYKYNTNTVPVIHKYNTFKSQIQPQMEQMQNANFPANRVLAHRGGPASCFDEKGPDIGIHHPHPSIIINELRAQPLVSLTIFKVLSHIQISR